jgi:adenylate kinase
MKVLLLGAPGAGKGTQAVALCERFEIPQISTGNMFRAETKNDSERGRFLKSLLDDGKLVPDEITIALVKERLSQPDCQKGFLLDGFPRNIDQAKALAAANLGLDVVIEIAVPDSEVIKRLSGRRLHEASGRTYHIDYQPPKEAGLDDVTGEPLILRKDDEPATVKKRLQLYHELTEPLVAFYDDVSSVHCIKVDGVHPVLEVTEAIFKSLEGLAVK